MTTLHLAESTQKSLTLTNQVIEELISFGLVKFVEPDKWGRK